MANPFQTVILKLRDMGAFQFLFPFMLTSAVFYGLLRKSQIFGEPDKNISVNAVVALVASFMVWAYPILSGVNIEQELASFFMHGVSATLTIMVGLLISSMFIQPNLPKQLSEIFGDKKTTFWSVVLVAALLIGGGILVSSGLINIFFPGGFSSWLSSDTASTIMVVLLVLGVIYVIVSGG